MEITLKRSQEIINQAIADYKPYAIVMMFLGGHDSLAAYHVAKALNVPITHFMHGITGTGIEDTTIFARRVGEQSGLRYIEANAGDMFESYVLRKGFFGIGEVAHEFAYHVLKHQHFRRELSRHIRHKKRNRNILLLNGARHQESDRRKWVKHQPIRVADDIKSNIWVNVINDWSSIERNDFVADYERNPVYDILHRSGECLCGTMQYPYQETRKEVSFWFQKWGKWLDDLEQKACDNHGFCWKWGEDLPPGLKAQKAREKQIANGQTELPFLPMCQSCQFKNHAAHNPHMHGTPSAVPSGDVASRKQLTLNLSL